MNLKKVNILLADDDTDDCLFFKKAISELTIETSLVAVHDGEQLMHSLVNETENLPDILFLDLNMPRKNGFECLSEIKHSPRLKKLPVIVFSTSFEQEVVNRLYKNGAQYFIRKPSEFSQYKKIIEQSLLLVMQQELFQPERDKFVLTIQSNQEIKI